MPLQNKTDKVNTRSNSITSLNSPLGTDSRNEPTITSFDQLWEKMNSANERIEAKLESCLARISTVEEKLESLEGEFTSKVLALTTTVAEVKSGLGVTNERIDRNEKYRELIISGIPFTSNENLLITFQHITKTLGYTSAPIVGLKRMARTPIKPGECPAIVCQFALPLDRDAFYRKYMENRNLNLTHIGYQSTNRIYINENLTLPARNIRKEALKLRREGLLRQVYTKDGVVFVKSSSATADSVAAVACHSLAQLEKFKTLS